MPGTGFTVEPSAFVGLSSGLAVARFRQLLWAEAGRVGVGRHLINVPDCINVGDGGVDAFIDDADPSEDDVIPRGASVFQIKATDLGPIPCTRELHAREDLAQPLKSELSDRFQQGAAYVLVLMADITDARIKARRNAIRKELASFGHKNTEVRVYTANQLAGFASRHPALVVLLRPELSTCSPYERWGSSLDVSRPATFVPDPPREVLVDQITQALRERSTCVVIRLTGLPGVGKTRSAFEALRHDDLKHQVLYVQRANGLDGSPLLNALINDTASSAILVVDECDLDQHRWLTNALAAQGARLSLITMSYESGQVPRPSVQLHAEGLQKEAIEELLQQEYRSLPSSMVGRLAEFADGYPYIGILLAEQYMEEGPSQSHFSVSDDGLMNRLIGGSAGAGSDEFAATKAVLTGLSLFQRIGVAGAGEDEGLWLSKLVEVPWHQFQEIVNRQKERGIVQGENYVFVTPFMLRIHLLEQWWQAHGFKDEADFKEFTSGMPASEPPDLLSRFLEHFPYVSAVPRGSEFVKRIAESEAVSNYEMLNSELGSRFFLALTEADPAAALQTAQRVIGVRSREELLEFQGGRRAIIEALKRMGVWRGLFPSAAKLLLALAEAETEPWANNATGEFVGLFGVGGGPVASTEAPPAQRLPILKEALSSGSPERRKLGLKACEAALNTGPHFRQVGAEYQGVRREPELWRPSTYVELFDAYRSVWALTMGSLTYLAGEDRRLAVKVLLNSARGLTRLEPLADMVIETIRDLANDPEVDRRDLIARTIAILRYEGSSLPVETRKEWEQLAEDLSGDDFSSRMERYVAMDLLEDHFDREGNQVDQAQPELDKLAVEAAETPALLAPELRWLVTKRSKTGHRFGYGLGKRDLKEVVLATILRAQGAASPDDADLSFLGGYLQAMIERDEDSWEALLDEFAQDPVQTTWVLELTWRSGRLTRRAGQRVFQLAEQGVVAPAALRIFRYGGLVGSLTREDFSGWVELLLQTDELDAVSAALDLLMGYGGYNQHKEPAGSIVSHPSWFKPVEGRHHTYHDTFWWAHVAKALCKNHADLSLKLARLMLEHFGERGTVAGGLDGESRKVLDSALQQEPEEVWKLASSMLGPPIDGRAYYIADWLRGSPAFESGGSHILEKVPRQLIWAWADEDLEFRPRYLATFVPKVMCGPQDEGCLARELLLRYGHDPETRMALRSNFSSEGWSGPRSEHLSAKLSWLAGMRNQETESNVLAWIDEYAREIEQEIESAREQEERRGW